MKEQHTEIHLHFTMSQFESQYFLQYPEHFNAFTFHYESIRKLSDHNSDEERFKNLHFTMSQFESKIMLKK